MNQKQTVEKLPEVFLTKTVTTILHIKGNCWTTQKCYKSTFVRSEEP